MKKAKPLGYLLWRGKVNKTGLIDALMGMILMGIIWRMGGDIRNNKKLKAVQTG